MMGPLYATPAKHRDKEYKNRNRREQRDYPIFFLFLENPYIVKS